MTLAYISLDEVVIRLLAAAAMAFIIGFDREIRHKPLGLRTFILVALGSASFSLIVMELLHSIEDVAALRIDPSRVMEGIITGVGFLGAGAIIQGRGEVVGATTAAGIWVVGAIGMACGLGFYLYAAVATVLAAVVLTGLGLLERLLGTKG